MKKELIVGTVSVVVIWLVLDFLLIGVALTSIYEQTQPLWRPDEEKIAGAFIGAIFVSALCFTLLYDLGFSGAVLKSSILFGVYFGVIVGAMMGIYNYAVLPIPFSLAVGWFVGRFAQMVAGGLVLHWAYRRAKPS